MKSKNPLLAVVLVILVVGTVDNYNQLAKAQLVVNCPPPIETQVFLNAQQGPIPRPPPPCPPWCPEKRSKPQPETQSEPTEGEV